MKNVIKITALGLVGLLTLGACDQYTDFVNKYDPDGVLRCTALDVARAKAAEEGVTLQDWINTEQIAVCPTK